MKKIEFDENKNVVSAMVRSYRKQRGYTQQQLACKMQLMGVNMDQQMVSKIEQNRRIVTDYELACFCEILSVSPNELLAKFINRDKQSRFGRTQRDNQKGEWLIPFSFYFFKHDLPLTAP